MLRECPPNLVFINSRLKQTARFSKHNDHNIIDGQGIVE